MTTSFLENKILNLQARLKAENESVEENNMFPSLSSPRQGSGRRPKQLGDMGTPTRTRKHIDLPVSVLMQPRVEDTTEVEVKMKQIMKMSGLLTINEIKYKTELKDLEHLGELGSGTCGHVVRMLHKPSNTEIAVKQMRRSGNSEENKRITTDLEVVLKSHDCPYIVKCLGAFITESDVCICMELMATCFDRLLKKLKAPIPEDVLGKVALNTVKALSYLKESHDVIHRDVKPSNILLDEKGDVKLCDFGISGRLVDSKARTKNAGCAAYMAPERIEPRQLDYDIRADIWSLGITLVELATGVFPYRDCKCDFEVLSRVLNDDPPSLPHDQYFTVEFRNFVSSCLIKDYKVRPKYKQLLEHPFLLRYVDKSVNVAEWYAEAIKQSSTPKSMKSIIEDVPTSVHKMSDHQLPQLSLIDKNKINGNVVLDSPRPIKRFPSTEVPPSVLLSPYKQLTNGNNSVNTSPLLLQRFYHQQNQHHSRSSSVSPSRFERNIPKESNPPDSPKPSPRKSLISAYLKYAPWSKTPPSPPPRNQGLSATASPLMTRREMCPSSPAPTRKTFDASPALSRRYVSPVPPTPPPRRLSESGSSPLHTFYQQRLFGQPKLAEKDHRYTPQPRRRVVCQFNDI
ncbi:dual specificity mitogen-activated protein kinase kinase 7-like [Adelges cooleyi]|uniref:dual specificity mitogen-activated protein kinase kinase 7-like n=1 Tax=Adelges cooleyi TaxID=133065 RepID=UPI0021808F3B|nr:dual specificity mitogen-activated protein kinase kinase 7-like [Adelges cooleyi]